MKVTHGPKVEVFSADHQGVINLFSVSVAIPEECGEACNHNNGTPYIEHIICQIKDLQRFAVLYFLHNSNFQNFKFTRI